MAGKKTVQITIRIEPELVKEADALAEIMSQPGIEITQTDVFRAAIRQGLAVLRRQRR